jgi:hypothetical protein
MIDSHPRFAVSCLGPHFRKTSHETNTKKKLGLLRAQTNLHEDHLVLLHSHSVVMVIFGGEAMVIYLTHGLSPNDVWLFLLKKTLTNGAVKFHDIYLA